tara:strand:- start:412 stop:1023 length:612 start_codon:yes stop_codon:yes gene_type:complete
MKIVWIIFIGFFTTMLLVMTFNSKENVFIEESKHEIKKIDSVQHELFSEADNIITNIILENCKKDSIFENLNGELNSEKNKLKYLVNKLKSYSTEVNETNDDYIKKIDSLERKLSFTKKKSVEKDVFIEIYLDSIELNNNKIKDYNNRIEEYINDTNYISYDTVYKTIYSIDTLLIPLENIKTLKLKKDKKERKGLFNNLFKK